eukprot:gene4054-5797_t
MTADASSINYDNEEDFLNPSFLFANNNANDDEQHYNPQDYKLHSANYNTDSTKKENKPNEKKINRSISILWRKTHYIISSELSHNIHSQSIEVIKMKGNFWKVMGYTNNKKNYLYLEEALYLAEKKQLIIYEPIDSNTMASINNDNESNFIDSLTEKFKCLEFKCFYTYVINSISLPCYLVFIKLKSMEYIAFRYHKNIKAFENDLDIYEHLMRNPQLTLLQALISFKLFIPKDGFSKKQSEEMDSIAYVMIRRDRFSVSSKKQGKWFEQKTYFVYGYYKTGDRTLSAKILLKLLEEAKGVPLFIAVVLRSGNVVIEEFTNALVSIKWENIFPVSHDGVVTNHGVIRKEAKKIYEIICM